MEDRCIVAICKSKEYLVLSHSEFNPVFIVGFPRSGTTLLATHLGRHSRIAVPPETQFFKGVLLCGRTEKGQSDHKVIISTLAKNRRILDLGLDLEEVYERFRCYEPSYSMVLKALLESYTVKEGKVRPAEKSPGHLLYVPLILQWYPVAKVICIIRDGRAAVSSLMRVPWHHKNLAKHCAEWNYFSKFAVKYSNEFKKSFLLLRYEDLVANPEKELTRICEFIGEEFEISQLETGKTAKTVPDWEKAWKANVEQEIAPARIHAWKEEVSLRDHFIMENIMGSWLAYWGYEPLKQRNISLRNRLLYGDISYAIQRQFMGLIKVLLCKAGLRDLKIG